VSFGSPDRYLLHGGGPREQALFEHTVATDLLPSVLPPAPGKGVRRPEAWFLIGQPGVGKTTLATDIHRRLDTDGGCDRIDADRYYAIHPNYAAAAALGPEGPARELMPDVQEMRDRVVAEVADRAQRGTGRHMLMETTARVARDFALPARKLHHNGEGHEVVAAMVVTPAAISALSVLVRHAGGGHLVADDDHDQSLEAQFATARAIDSGAIPARGRIYARDPDRPGRFTLAYEAPEPGGSETSKLENRLLRLHLKQITHRDMYQFSLGIGNAQILAGPEQEARIRGAWERLVPLVPPYLRDIAQTHAELGSVGSPAWNAEMALDPRTETFVRRRRDHGPSSPVSPGADPRRTEPPAPPVSPAVRSASLAPTSATRHAVSVARAREPQAPVPPTRYNVTLARLLGNTFGPLPTHSAAGNTAGPSVSSPSVAATFRSTRRTHERAPDPTGP